MNTLVSALPSSAVTGGNWDGPGPWWPIIPLLWLLLVVSVIATFAYVGRRRWRQLNAQAGQRAGEARLAERFAAGEPICVMLGDNLIERDIVDTVKAFNARAQGACILLKEVEDPERFGVAVLEGDRIARIIEKPRSPPSNLAVIGIYLYDPRVFEIIKTLKPSGRGELEITDVNNAYIANGQMSYGILKGWWTDAGTFESLLRASRLVAEGGANKVG